MNVYYLRARLMPTIITAFPLISVYLFIFSPYLSKYLKEIIPFLPIVGNVSLSTAIVFFLIQVNRTLSKELLQSRYFKGELKMPTTDFLLYSDNEYSPETKQMIRDKIKEHFNMNLYDAQREAAEELRARLLIKEAVGQIITLLRGNKLILRHNIEYGALRNFFGGCIQALFFSLILIVNYYFVCLDKGLLILSLTFFTFYATSLLLSKWIIKRYGNNYAKILYQEFLAVPKP